MDIGHHPAEISLHLWGKARYQMPGVRRDAHHRVDRLRVADEPVDFPGEVSGRRKHRPKLQNKPHSVSSDCNDLLAIPLENAQEERMVQACGDIRRVPIQTEAQQRIENGSQQLRILLPAEPVVVLQQHSDDGLCQRGVVPGRVARSDTANQRKDTIVSHDGVPSEQGSDQPDGLDATLWTHF